MNRLDACDQALRRAGAARESPECLHELILDVASALAAEGATSQAARARESAMTLVPMFGMQADSDRRAQRWWRRRRWQPPDYRARADLYRTEGET